MTEKGINNNQVEVAGEIISTFEYSHEIFGEGFYMVKLLVNRLSEATDEIPLMISERLVDVTKDCRGKYLRAFGQFRSYNKHEENHNHLILSVFVMLQQEVFEKQAMLAHEMKYPLVIHAVRSANEII